jgi:pyruvate formate lyase activating enzyme
MAKGVDFFKQKLTRREFIKKSIIGLGTLSLAGYALNRYAANAITDQHSLAYKNDAPRTLWKWSKQAEFFTRIGENIQCKLCPHECTLGLNDRGFCKVRVNKDNNLYTIAYGNPCAVHNDPIEKKPLYHFIPGTKTFSIATAGCNLRCKNCQNWEISQSRPEDTTNIDLMPERVVEAALQAGAKSISYTYSEPSIFYEYMVDTARAAKRNGLKNIWVTAGYISKKPLRKLTRYIDGANIDLKGFSERNYIRLNGGRLQPVLDSIKTLKENDVWFEITNLIVPTWSDDPDEYRDMISWIYKTVGPDVPIHISRFHPYYKLVYLPATPVSTLNSFREIALEEGMIPVYVMENC